METKVKRYFLDYIFDKTEIVLDLGRNFKIEKDTTKNFELNKFFYKQIGKDHFWRDRLVWTDKEWRKYISNKNFETWIMKKENELVGYYEREYHVDKNEVELINMGVLREFRGQKLGSNLLTHVLKKAREEKVSRVWVHTCSLDHQNALKNYKSRNFKIFKEEQIDFVA